MTYLSKHVVQVPNYFDALYVSASEACYGIFAFELLTFDVVSALS